MVGFVVWRSSNLFAIIGPVQTALKLHWLNKELNSTAPFKDLRSSSLKESPNIILKDLPEIEKRRDAVHDFSNEGIPPGHSYQKDKDNAAEVTGSLDQMLDANEICTPTLKSESISGGESMHSHEHS